MQGVNDSGVIVGESAIASGTSHAFVYGLGGNNTMQDMNTVFGSSGYNIIPSGWTLTDAYGIDNDGDIAGFASNGTYNLAFLIAASVPEPCTLLLAAIGLAGLLAYAWKKRQPPTPAPAWDRAKIVDAFLAANCKSPGGNGEGR